MKFPSFHSLRRALFDLAEPDCLAKLVELFIWASFISWLGQVEFLLSLVVLFHSAFCSTPHFSKYKFGKGSKQERVINLSFCPGWTLRIFEGGQVHKDGAGQRVRARREY